MLLVLLLAAVAGWYIWERRQRRTGQVPPGCQQHINLPHEQEWELYHNDFSLCSKKTRVCLAELGITYKSHHIDLIETGSYENISRCFLRVNPAATVPVLVHNGHPVYESHEQIVYAAEQVAAQPGVNLDAALTPADPEKKQLMDYWVHKGSLVGDNPVAAMHETAGNTVPGLTLPIFAAMIAHIPGYRILEGLLFHRIKQRALFFLMLKLQGINKLPNRAPLRKGISRSRAALHQHLDELEAVLAAADGPWIVGQQFTLADVSMMVIFSRLDEGDWVEEFLTAERPAVTAYWRALRERPSYTRAILEHSHPLVARARETIVQLKRTSPQFREALLG